MKAAGIIAEFNPFHNGHKYIIDSAKKECDCVIAVISGNFVQRGSPAVFNKFVRATAAINNGVDIVIELPSPWSASFAENFAFGGISILNELNVSDLFFGCESDSLEKLIKIAKEDDFKFDETFTGTYAKARQIALEKTLGNEYSSLLEMPNNNLAIEYIKASNKLKYSPKLHAIKRIGASHDSNKTNDVFASASHIRELITSSKIFYDFIPQKATEIYKDAINKKEYISDEKFSNAVISILRKSKSFDNLPELSEGIENRFKKALINATDYDQLVDSVKTKRYTRARVRRLILSAFLDIDNAWVHEEAPYLNILGFSKIGEQYLKEVSDYVSKPYIFSMKPSKQLSEKAELLLSKECERNDVYMSLLHSTLPCKSDYTYGLIKRMD